MLYNVDENEEKNNEEFNNFERAYSRKINVKKIIVFISSALICLFILVGSFLLTYKGMNKDSSAKTEMPKETTEQVAKETQQIQQEAEKQTTVQDKNVQEQSSTEQNMESNTIENALPAKNEDKKAEKYEGNHMQIPIHSFENIQKGFVPGENPNAQEEIKQIYYSNEKQIYLTFDDGPSKEITPQILDILKQENVLATFFVLGSRFELNPSIVQREFEEGHFIANHGYSHKYSQIYASVESVYEEYSKCQQAVQNALNNSNYFTRLFRFPGGSSGGPYNDLKSKAKADLISKGIATTNWNALTGDAEGIKDKQALIDKMISSIGKNQSIVLLMHDAGDKSYTVEALPDIIKYFKDRGYTFKNFYEIFN